MLVTTFKIYEEKEVTSELSRAPGAAGLWSLPDEQMAFIVTVNVDCAGLEVNTAGGKAKTNFKTNCSQFDES